MANGNHCMYFVERKMRFCRMTVREGRRYCGEHQQDDVEDDRVPCPLDPTHTCYRSRLTRHLGVCNTKRSLDERPVFVVDGANLDDEDAIAAPPRVPLSQLDGAVVGTVIRKIYAAYEDLPEFSQTILRHDVLRDKLNEETCGSNVKRHLLQNASLLGHLERVGLLRDNTCFIEFGAGKVDRSSHRHKNDNKLRREESRLAIKRIRADIADLQLNQIEEIQPIKYKVGIAKHLCGAATDLTIRCLTKSMSGEPRVDVRGLIVAFCCHHKCEYSSYVGREYLQRCGFTADEFPILCSIVSWATCGFRTKDDFDSPRDSTMPQNETADRSSRSDEREVIGRMAKTLLNWGRLVFLESVGFQTELLYYIPTEVSLENMCVVATREHSS
ncbi:tRNA:m(4)X modification enzyme TRM13 homolog isoform X2 [Monomorium pharaonis]|uniref:tRNA:m(4)X modification enzyme TRM13 homolog isoform X2 n=1 Tax=Monomorium pharaonis TaxID=307658 RepID=UPI0017468366|nr:tRNA:m(4)X modification enzyme TRM13 homolog isoform X2 [Monomorium pharaonis]